MEAFKKCCDIPLALIFNIKHTITKETGLDIKIYEENILEKSLKEIGYKVEADKSEIICINDLFKEISGSQADGGSGFVKGMKTWRNSFDTYLEKLKLAEELLLQGEMQKDTERMRLLKEAVINFPQNMVVDTAESLEAKFVTADVMNLMSTVFKRKAVTQRMIS